MTHEEQIAHWKERALIAERALDDLYNRARDYAAPVGGGRIMIEGFGSPGARVRTAKAIMASNGMTLEQAANLTRDLPQIVIDRSGRLARALGELVADGYQIGWRHV